MPSASHGSAMIIIADLCRFLPTLGEDRAHILAQILSSIEGLAPLQALFIHGSHTRSTHDVDSDVDVIAVLDTRERAHMVVQELPVRVRRAMPILTSAYTEKYPWFGRLWTFYVECHPLFAVDLGIITVEELSRFFVEPDTVILRDANGAVSERMRQCYLERIAGRANRCSEAEFEVFHTVTKIERALRAGHIWNAFEYVNILRRTFFGILREATDPPEYVHVGRPERDIESTIPWVALEDWSITIPAYRAEAIVATALDIIERIRMSSTPTFSFAHSRLLNIATQRLSCFRRLPAP